MVFFDIYITIPFLINGAYKQHKWTAAWDYMCIFATLHFSTSLYHTLSKVNCCKISPIRSPRTKIEKSAMFAIAILQYSVANRHGIILIRVTNNTGCASRWIRWSALARLLILSSKDFLWRSLRRCAQWENSYWLGLVATVLSSCCSPCCRLTWLSSAVQLSCQRIYIYIP